MSHIYSSRGSASTEPFVQMSGITKRFAGALALDDVSIEVGAGEVHSLVGANGAGKSTLGKILAGVHKPDSGQIRVYGEKVGFASPRDALARGIAIMQQEIALAGKMSVIDNVFLGTEFGSGPFLRRKAQLKAFGALTARTGFRINPYGAVEDLRLGEQQQVAVLWALARHARLVVMDEPTASLDRTDSHRLLDTAERLSEEGIAVVFVSHFLDEVQRISDTITVLANGRHVMSQPAGELTESTIVSAMIGGSLDSAFPALPPRPGPGSHPLIQISNMTQAGVVNEVSLDVQAGEVVGIYGLVGSGRSEFAHLLAGASKSTGGEIRIGGRPVEISNPRSAIKNGVTLLPESRKEQGLMLGRAVLENTSLSSLDRYTNALGFIDRGREKADATAVLDPLSLRGGNRLEEEVGNFSGGNQQKVLLGKCLLTRPKLLILDEPTRGVDIGAKRAIYDTIHEVAAAGTAVVLISSEQEEVLHLCHRIGVFRDGRLTDMFDHGEVDEDRLLTAALGTDSASPTHEGTLA